MSTKSQGKQASASPLRNLAYASAVIGGGVVGLDYAAWFEVSPMIGAVLGSTISAAITKFLFHLQDDPDGQIREACTGFGALVGAVTGIYIGLQNYGGAGGFFGGGLAGGLLGVVAGQILAALISLAAFALLFISRGPVGLFLRNVILKGNDVDSSSQQFDQLDSLMQAGKARVVVWIDLFSGWI